MRNGLAATCIALVAILGLTTLPAQAAVASRALAGEVELVGFAAALTLDGRPYTIVDGEVTPAADVTTRGSTFPPTGVHTFTRQNPGWTFGDANGTGAEQINYTSGYEQWGYKLTPALQRIIVGNVHQLADLYHYSTRSSYGVHDVAPSYQFHGSHPGIEARGTYSTTFRATFRHNVGPGGNGVLSAQWNWQRR